MLTPSEKKAAIEKIREAFPKPFAVVPLLDTDEADVSLQLWTRQRFALEIADAAEAMKSDVLDDMVHSLAETIERDFPEYAVSVARRGTKMRREEIAVEFASVVFSAVFPKLRGLVTRDRELRDLIEGAVRDNFAAAADAVVFAETTRVTVTNTTPAGAEGYREAALSACRQACSQCQRQDEVPDWCNGTGDHSQLNECSVQVFEKMLTGQEVGE